MKRRSAIEDLKFLQNELVMLGQRRSPALDVAITDMEKLEKVESIILRMESKFDDTCNLDLLMEIKEVIEQ